MHAFGLKHDLYKKESFFNIFTDIFDMYTKFAFLVFYSVVLCLNFLRQETLFKRMKYRPKSTNASIRKISQ